MPSAKRRKAKLWVLVGFLLLSAVAIPRLLTSFRRGIMASESPYMMKLILVGLHMYAEENDGFFPPEDGIAGLRRLLAIENFGPELLACSDIFPAATNIRDVEEGNTSYIYIGGHSLSSPPRTILLIEKLAPGQPVAHVGLADGSVVGVNDIAKP